MKPRRKNFALFSLVVVIVFSLLCWVGHTVQAQDAKTMLKEVNQGLRQAERDMFAGNNDKAIASLDPLKEKLTALQAADPNNPGLKAAQNKYEKLVKDLERRTGKNLGGGTLTATETSSQPALPAKPEATAMPETAAPAKSVQAEKAGGTAKLPYDARAPYSKATSEISRIDGYIERLQNPDFNRDQVVKNMDLTLSSARENLDKARALAAEKGVTQHPDFEKAEADLAAANQKATDAKAAYEDAKVAAAAQSKEVDADVKALLDEYNRVEPVFAKATGYVSYYNDLETVKALIADIESFEKNERDNLEAKMAAFAHKYGATGDEIDKKADAMGYSGQARASFPYTGLSQGIENVEKTRVVMADDLIRRAQDMKDQTSKGIHDFARPKQYQRIRGWGEMAARFDPDNPRVKEFNSGLDAWIAEDMKTLNAKVDKVTWPENASNAPGDAKELCKVAVEFLQKEEDRRAAENKEVGRILAVVITGPWRVFQKNILGEPIQYNLPILCAVQYESDKDLNVARVYDSTLLTEERKGVAMAPPFTGATVGNSYYIRPSAVK
jgi:hypothetical protein